MAERDAGGVLRIGHKGADAIAPGNTLASFEAAVEVGVDIVELDVLRPRGDFDEAAEWTRAQGGPARASGPLLVAHDWGAATRGEPLTLDAALDAFTRPPLDRVRFDLDLKIAGREDEVVRALGERGLTDRAMVSGMELSGLRWIAEHAPQLRLGRTIPRLTRDWRRHRGVAVLLPLWQAWLRRRLPDTVERQLPRLSAWAAWVFHPLITPGLIAAARRGGIAVIAWTVDDAARMRQLEAMGVDGIVSNDPRLFGQLDCRPPAGPEA